MDFSPGTRIRDDKDGFKKNVNVFLLLLCEATWGKKTLFLQVKTHLESAPEPHVSNVGGSDRSVGGAYRGGSRALRHSAIRQYKWWEKSFLDMIYYAPLPTSLLFDEHIFLSFYLDS